MLAFNAVGLDAVAMSGAPTPASGAALGATLVAAASLIGGAATVQGNAPGAAVIAATSVVWGAAGASAGAPGVSLVATSSVAWGALTVPAVAPGSVLIAQGVMAAGLPSAPVQASGADLLADGLLVPGEASTSMPPLPINPRMTYVSGQRTDFYPMRAQEVEVITIDFGPALAEGETIVTATWSNTVIEGIDPDPTSIIKRRSTVTGAMVSELFAPVIPGVTYAPVCTVQTSGMQTLILPEYGHGRLEVTL